MRLTNQNKNRTIENILADLPKVNNADAMRKRAVEISVPLLPEAVQKLYLDPATTKYINMEYASVCCMSYRLPCGSDTAYGALANEIKADAVWAALHKAHDDARNARHTMKLQLEASFRSVTTDKQFKEQFPDLVKYLPGYTAEVVANLPATTSLMDNLKAAGLKVEEKKEEE